MRFSLLPEHYRTNFHSSAIFKKSWEHAKEVQTSFVDLGKVWKVYCWVTREEFCGCCGSTVLTGTSCWPSSNSIPAQKIVSVSTDGSHNRSALVLDAGSGVCCHHSSVYIRALYTPARGPNPTCETFSPDAIHFANNEKIIYLRKMC